VLTGDGSSSCDIEGGQLFPNDATTGSLTGQNTGFQCSGINTDSNLTSSSDAETTANDAFLDSSNFPDPQEDSYTELDKDDVEDISTIEREGTSPLDINIKGKRNGNQIGTWTINLDSPAFQVDLDGDGSGDAIRNDIVIGLSGGGSNSLYRLQLDKFNKKEFEDKFRNVKYDDDGQVSSISGDWDTLGLKAGNSGNQPDLSNARALGRYSMGLSKLEDDG